MFFKSSLIERAVKGCAFVLQPVLSSSPSPSVHLPLLNKVGCLPKTVAVGDYVGHGVYRTPVVNGKAEGFGTWTGPEWNVYKGTFTNHMLYGQGIFTTVNGDKYVGTWEAEMKHGQGSFMGAYGSMYTGAWKADKKHGQGAIMGKSETSMLARSSPA
jgi:hypothetical protein